MYDRAETLCYRVTGTPKVTTFENSVFTLEISGDQALFQLKRDFFSLSSAEAAISEFLQSFEADETLQGRSRVSFTFERGRMKSGSSIYVGPQFRLNIAGALAEENQRHQTPWQRPAVSDTPEAAELWKRYEQYKAGEEKLSTVAYVTLSYLQTKAGGRKKAASTFVIQNDVLDRIGELSSDHGDLASARKFDGSSSGRNLSEAEAFWLESATRKLIIRVHEIESSLPLAEVRMCDLP